MASVDTAPPASGSTSSREAPSYARTIRPPRGVELGVRDLVEERELLGFFTWRNVSVRYKQSLAGPGWAILQPLLSMIIFTTCLSQ